MTSRSLKPAKATFSAGCRLTDAEDAALEASRHVLRCDRTRLVRQGVSLITETILAASANGVHVRNLDDLRAFLAEKLRPSTV